jgi:hypothetical protein
MLLIGRFSKTCTNLILVKHPIRSTLYLINRRIWLDSFRVHVQTRSWKTPNQDDVISYKYMALIGRITITCTNLVPKKNPIRTTPYPINKWFWFVGFLVHLLNSYSKTSNQNDVISGLRAHTKLTVEWFMILSPTCVIEWNVACTN